MVIAVLVFLFFFADLLLRLAGMYAIAPFAGASLVMDIVFSAAAALLGYLSFRTLRERR
jgi:hypothetical protein